MTTPERVVFDCNVFFQALISPRGPARRLLGMAADGDLSLFVSAQSLDELSDVVSRPHLVQRYGLNTTVVAEFIEEILSFGTLLDAIPHVFDFPRDPADAHYVDLAVAARAKLIVTRDKDLLSLRDLATPEGRDFQMRFPALSVLTPPELLAILDGP